MSEPITRREFIGKSVRTAAGVGLGMALAEKLSGLTVVRAQTVSPNEKIQMGVIGCGGMGMANMHSFMDHDDVEIIAVCDVDSNHMAQATADVEKKYGRKPVQYKDFRQVLEMKEVDAVLISTPDHWHALPMILACEAGKDVYVEKPIAHDIREGRAMVNAAKKYKRVVQVGTWQRSTQHFVDAIDYVRSGKLGRIPVCRAWTCGGAGVGHQEPSNPPPELDWDFWLGPAPFVPYRPNRCHGSFRWFFDYAAGLTGDWGVHMIDIVLLGMNAWHPLQVHSVGGKIISGENDDRDTPDTQMAVFRFPDFIMNWEIHVGGPGLDGGGHHGAEFIGERGILMIDRDGWKVTPQGEEKLEKTPSENRVNDHWSNFLDCMRTRQMPRSDIETMHYTTTVCHLANIAYLTGRSLRWNKDTEKIEDRDAMKCQCYQRPYRKPWKLRVHRVEGERV